MSAPYYRMFPREWDDGTACLTLEQEGALLRVCNTINSRGQCLPDTDETDREMMHRCRVSMRRWRAIKSALLAAGKITIRDGKIYQARALSEVAYRAEIAENGAKGGRKRAENLSKTARKPAENDAADKKNKDLPQANQNQNQNHKNIDASAGVFEGFWQGYPRKQGTSKANARKVFERLQPDEQKQAVAALAEFSRSVAQTEERYIPHAATWLNQRRFETLDEQKPTADPALWRLRLERLRDSGFWDAWLGPRPGTLGCDCPDDLQREFGFIPRPARAPP